MDSKEPPNEVAGERQQSHGSSRHVLSAEECTRLRGLKADIVNYAYYERYEAMERATQELLALAAELQEKYGPLNLLLAVRANHVYSESERESLLQAVYTQAESKGDTDYKLWAAASLASHYVDGRRDMTQGERWVSLAEECLRAGGDGVHRGRCRSTARHPRGQAKAGRRSWMARPTNPQTLRTKAVALSNTVAARLTS